MIKIEKLKKSFDSKFTLNIDDLMINKGSVFGIVGNNGAGKTTLLMAIVDLIIPESGTIYSKGSSVHRSEHWKEYTGSYLDENFLIDFLTPREYLNLISEIRHYDTYLYNDVINNLEIFLTPEILSSHKYLRILSQGNRHKAGITGAFLSGKEIIILDEPFNFLDPASQIMLKSIIKNFNKDREVSFIISSHNLNHIADICSEVILLEDGRVIKNIVNTGENMKEIEEYFLNQV